MSRLPQIRRIIFNDEQIGMGFNSKSGLAVGTALENFTVQEDPVAPGQVVTAEIKIVNSHEELMESLGMSFQAQGRYGFFSASAKAEFSESTRFNSTSTFLLARVVVRNPLRRGKNFKVTGEAKALLDALRFPEFEKAFGDSFVRGLQTGGEYYAVMRITSFSASTQSDLATTLQAEMNGLFVAGSFDAAFKTAKANSSTRSEFSATFYQKAGSGPQIAPTVAPKDVIQRFKNFPQIAKDSAAAYETEVATYDTLPLPVPTPEEQENFLLALADAREKKLRYIQIRNDLEFASTNQDFFEDIPSSEVLGNAILVYTKLINAVMAHAIKLSRGQITPPQLFDPSAVSPPIVEPAPIPLKRKKREGLLLVAGAMSSATFPKLLFDIPDNFQATTELTVIFPEPAISGPIQPGGAPTARHAGMAVLAENEQNYLGVSKRVDSGGQLVSEVDGHISANQHFPHNDSRPYFDDTVHLKIVVINGKLTAEFSKDGTLWNPLRKQSVSSRKLVLFAFSQDDKPVTAIFSKPQIINLTTP